MLFLFIELCLLYTFGAYANDLRMRILIPKLSKNSDISLRCAQRAGLLCVRSGHTGLWRAYPHKCEPGIIR